MAKSTPDQPQTTEPDEWTFASGTLPDGRLINDAGRTEPDDGWWYFRNKAGEWLRIRLNDEN